MKKKKKRRRGMKKWVVFVFYTFIDNEKEVRRHPEREKNSRIAKVNMLVKVKRKRKEKNRGCESGSNRR